MQKLCEWKFNKRSTEGQEKLLKAYLSKPAPLKAPEWTMSEETRLKQLLTEDMCAKDTAAGVQLKQTARALVNNIDDSDEESKAELLHKLQGDQREQPMGDEQCGNLQLTSKTIAQQPLMSSLSSDCSLILCVTRLASLLTPLRSDTTCRSRGHLRFSR